MIWKKKTSQRMVCANPVCPKQEFAATDILFVCQGGSTCPAVQQGKEVVQGAKDHFPNEFLFRAPKFDYSVSCPESPHQAYRKVCPYCWEVQPVASGRSDTIAVIGTSSSGKTCYIASLIRHIEKELSRQTSHGMALQWDDQAGLEYYRAQKEAIFSKHAPPDLTQMRVDVKSLQITVRFPLTRVSHKLLRQTQAVVPLVFPDPSGEFFENLEDAYTLDFLSKARQIILTVDPFASEEFREKRRAAGVAQFDLMNVTSAELALNAYINKIRNERKLYKGKLPQDLAIVLTKCDEDGVFDPDEEGFEVQGKNYNPKLTKEISRLIEQHMDVDLGLSQVVALSKQNFQHVAFFASSALGRPPVKRMRETEYGAELDQHFENPKPRRVEDPFLWLLHQRGFM